MRKRLVPAVLLSTVAIGVASSADAQDVARQCINASEQGLTLRQEGNLLEARKTLALCTHKECDADIQRTCTERIAEIMRVFPSIVVLAKDGAGNDLVGIKIWVDGVARAEPLAIELNPGPHSIKVEAPGWRRWRPRSPSAKRRRIAAWR